MCGIIYPYSPLSDFLKVFSKLKFLFNFAFFKEWSFDLDHLPRCLFVRSICQWLKITSKIDKPLVPNYQIIELEMVRQLNCKYNPLS